MRRFIAAAAIAFALPLVTASSAVAEPPHGDGGHTHYVETGNGDCHQIHGDNHFKGEERGMHRAAGESGSNGPQHGTCPA